MYTLDQWFQIFSLHARQGRYMAQCNWMSDFQGLYGFQDGYFEVPPARRFYPRVGFVLPLDTSSNNNDSRPASTSSGLARHPGKRARPAIDPPEGPLHKEEEGEN